MHLLPPIDTERVTFRHGVGDTDSYKNESGNALLYVGNRCLEGMAAYALRAPYPGKGPPCPPSNGTPDRSYTCGSVRQRYAL